MVSPALDNDPRPTADQPAAATAATDPGRHRDTGPAGSPPAGSDADTFLHTLYAEHSARPTSGGCCPTRTTPRTSCRRRCCEPGANPPR
jgi:hypothetical protein